MASQHEEMSDQDELIADLLGQGWTHQRVADSVGASSKTVQRRMSDPAFSKVVSERRRERFGQLSGQLLTAGNSAMDVLTGALPVDIEPAAPRCSRSTGFMNIPRLDSLAVRLKHGPRYSELTNRRPAAGPTGPRDSAGTNSDGAWSKGAMNR
jgi:hypothetical protein